MIIRDELKRQLEAFEIKCREETLAQLDLYALSVLKFNRSLNLISPTDPDKEIIKQIVDSAAMIRFCDISTQTILDIGSGGGIPGIVLKILTPDLKLHSLDSNPRKIAFQEKTTRDLEISGCTFSEIQISEFHPQEKFDIITCKAFGKFTEVFRLARETLQDDGSIILYLGDSIPEEIENNLKDDLRISDSFAYNLPEDLSKRQLIIIKKK